MLYFTPLPPELYEVLNCAIFAGSSVLLILCIRYLAAAYAGFRRAGFMSRWECFVALRTLKLAVGLTVLLSGVVPRMGYLWLSRYLANTGYNVEWMSHGWMIYIPIIGSALDVLGCACTARAIIPEVWGRFGYFGTLAVAAGAVVLTQVLRDPYQLAISFGAMAVLALTWLTMRVIPIWLSAFRRAPPRA